VGRELPPSGSLAVAALEALDPTGSIDELLLAGEERVAVATDLEPQLLFGGVGLECVTARTDDGHEMHFGMNSLLHGLPLFSVEFRRVPLSERSKIVEEGSVGKW
jgi:hypothetical protein